MSTETGRERYWRQIREIAKEEGISQGAARNRWSEIYYPGGRRRIVITAPREALPPELLANCPWCAEIVEFNEASCPRCATMMHLACIEEFGRNCTTLGCGGRLSTTRQGAPTARAIRIGQQHLRTAREFLSQRPMRIRVPAFLTTTDVSWGEQTLSAFTFAILKIVAGLLIGLVLAICFVLMIM